MPLFHYVCECNHSVSKFHRQVASAPALITCEKCGKDAKKTLKAPASVSKVIVDNGFQARAVEVNPEIIEINKARSEKDYRED